MLDAFVFEPFSVNEQLIDSLLLEPDQFEAWIALRTDGNKGTGTEWDPYDGSSHTLLDDLLGSFPPYTTVHLGSGVFQTQGYAATPGGWRPKSGQRILGDGIGETTIKLINASDTANLTSVIGAPSTNFLNGFEVADLTVDCNLGGQSNTSVACGALSISGTHIYIHRVRVINFGTQTTSVKGGAILVGNVDPSTPQVFDCVVEDCSIEQPSANNVRETTCIGIGAKEDSNGAMAYHRACVIRDCFIDCTYTNNPLVVSSITYVGTTAALTTQLSHGLLPGLYWIVVTGALENGVLSTNYNGSFLASVAGGSTNVFTFTMPGTPTYQPTGEMYIGRIPSQRVAIQSISLTGIGPYTATMTTLTPHNRIIPGNVVVNAVNISGSYNNAYNGSFQITSILSPTQLQYTMTSNPGTADFTNAYLGADFRAIEADGGVGTIIENNRIYNCVFGCYHDSYSSKDMVIRDNYFRGLNAAVYQKMGGISGGDSNQNPTYLGTSTGALVRSGTTATFTTQQPHGLSVGQAVRIAGAKVAGVLSPYYNGTFAVVTVSSPTQFTYTMTQDPGANGDNSPIPTFGALWQVGRLIIENNVIELILNVVPSGWEAPVGINLYDGVGSHGSQYIFQQLIARGNVIRHVDNASDSSQIPIAVCLDSCLNAIVEGNDINLDATVPVRYYTLMTAKYFNNQSPGGKLIQGASCTRSGSYSVPIYVADTLNRYLNELTTDADLGLSLST